MRPSGLRNDAESFCGGADAPIVQQNDAAKAAVGSRRQRLETLGAKGGGGSSAPVSSDSSPSEDGSSNGDQGSVARAVGIVDPPTVSTIRPVEKPAVLLDGDAPYCIVDANEEWLAACSYSSVDQVTGQTLSIIQGPQVSRLSVHMP
jgi:hypothetical protein